VYSRERSSRTSRALDFRLRRQAVSSHLSGKEGQRRGRLAYVPLLYQMCTKRAENRLASGLQGWAGCVVCVRKVRGF
jgi:hypothetical protein